MVIRRGAKRRTPVPADVSAKAMFLSDRTCCVCREPGKPVQIHHVDEDPSNHTLKNLAVLCLDCHTLTMIKGGFHRRLGTEQVLLYRDDWVAVVAGKRSPVLAPPEADKGRPPRIELATSKAEALRENREFALLASHYHNVGDVALRDKYIDRALASRRFRSPQVEIFLRSLQGRMDLVNSKTRETAVKELSKPGQESQLARLYATLGDWTAAAKTYSIAIARMLDNGNVFSAAYYSKEFAEAKLYDHLFELDLRDRADQQDLWWQVRCLQELGWRSELDELLKSKRAEIESSDDDELKSEYYKATGQHRMYIDTEKKIASEQRLMKLGNSVGVGQFSRDRQGREGTSRVRSLRRKTAG